MSKITGNQSMATSLRTRKRSMQIASSNVEKKLERAKSIATIFSAIAIPIVLMVGGYFIQKQLSSDGIRKDYVGIATAILKEKSENQEPELRAWAVKILDENAPIPFSKKAKEGLLSGVVVPGLAWIGPPEDCRTPPKNRTIVQQFEKLAKDSHTLDDEAYMGRLIDFAKTVVKAEEAALVTAARLKCMQDWAAITEKSDIEYRNSIGAPSSKSIFEELRKKNSAVASTASTPKHGPSQTGKPASK